MCSADVPDCHPSASREPASFDSGGVIASNRMGSHSSQCRESWPSFPHYNMAFCGRDQL